MSSTVKLPIDVTAIQAVLPHRYPFLLVDRVVELEPNKRVLAYKNVTVNEPFFNGHFPGHPVMPGVLVVEALAQAGGLLTQLASGGSADDRLFYLVKIDNARFSRMVVPGDRLELEVVLKRTIRNMAIYSGIARVDGEQAACADIVCAEVAA
ncbi:3-hydroxyacyl-ACP dehydratase FabZ [Lysobacter maris]|uniref:3-hydroxyacyl-[acyl-carrier-protein] dehydratase FabZ n=1 Tax=Marilutibacter maris TaxID=1605891 RepID=A0A508AS26_9GAMM|nr:3-hydroxyacyl-ACP dehydratase FabZ [Lysobacter maris]KAB8192105.1 3-hydroxyacyl-ACP dehydratase FabZ [Lysobacter maris]